MIRSTSYWFYVSILFFCIYPQTLVASYFMLPKEVKSTSVSLYHPLSARQQGPSCGWYAIFNAKAIQDDFKAHHEVDPQRVLNQVTNTIVPDIYRQQDAVLSSIYAEQFMQGLLVGNMYLLAKYLGVNNCYFIFKKENALYLFAPQGIKGLQGLSHTDVLDQVCYRIADFQHLARSIKESGVSLVHYVFVIKAERPFEDGIERHAVLLSVVYPEMAKPYAYYLDSNNQSLLASRSPYRKTVTDTLYSTMWQL